MPRTKVPKDKTVSADKNTDKLDLALGIQKLQEDKVKKIELLKKDADEAIASCHSFIKTLCLSIPPRLFKKTLAEIKRGDVNDTTIATTISSVPSTRSIRRSASFTNDEGYSTADSQGNSMGRQSRSRSRALVKEKAARSLSRTSMKKAVRTFKTPSNTNKPNMSVLTVTPKFKPNMAQVMLRRPKQGEVALSMQGSPLFVGPVVSDNLANVNIPAPDGYTFTLQPQRGLRESQIPEVNSDVQRQLEILRDHLNIVCALAPQRK